MKFLALAKLGSKHLRNSLAEWLYLKTGLDLTRPVSFYCLINEHCNSKCRYCGYWRQEEYRKELTLEQWQKALLGIKDFVGSFQINFSGGEPLLRPDFIGLLEFCRQNKIYAGVTTNGTLLTAGDNTRKLVAARPFNVNISVDCADAKVNDYLRGVPGSLEKAERGIKILIAERSRQKADFPVIIKPTITALNYKTLPDLVQWAEKMGVSAVNFQPLDRWIPEADNELWLNEKQILELEEIVKTLIEMKKKGAPILNSEEVLRLFPDAFREKKAPESLKPCLVGLRNFFIRPDGEVRSCFSFPVLGNIKDQTAKEIWRGKQAKQVRRQTLQCSKLCLLTCVSQKTIWQKVKMGLKIMR